MGAASGGLEIENLEVELGNARGNAENLNTDDLVLVVEVKDDGWNDLFGLDDIGFVKAEIEGIGFFVDFEPRKEPLAVLRRHATGRGHGRFRAGPRDGSGRHPR